MKCPFIILLLVSLLLSSSVHPQKDAPISVSLIQLIANPETFDRKPVTVRGYLVFNHQEHLQLAGLFFHEEDADNGLDNALAVQPTEQMLRDEERIDRMYVILTGTVRVTHAINGATLLGITDIQRCDPWSDPRHPRGLKGDGNKPSLKDDRSKPSLKDDRSKPN